MTYNSYNLEQVLIDKRESLSTEDLRIILDRLGLINKLLTSKNIVIKPNFAAGTYVAADSHVVTDISFLKDLTEGIKSLNPESTIFIAESDSTGYGFAFLKFANLGIDTWSLDGVETLDLSRDILEHVEHPGLLYFSNIDRQLWLSKKLLNADFIISASNLKSNSVTRFTGACKNLFGLLPVMNKEQYHTEIDQVIHDLTVSIKVDFSIVDAFYGMERNGPVQGVPVNLGYRVFSSSPIVADITCCSAIGLDWRHVGHLKLLDQVIDKPISNIKLDDIRQKILPPTLWLRFFNRFGLIIQSLGRNIYQAGHRIHCADSPLSFIITVIRPLLLSLFKRETLQKWQQIIKGRNGNL